MRFVLQLVAEFFLSCVAFDHVKSSQFLEFALLSNQVLSAGLEIKVDHVVAAEESHELGASCDVEPAVWLAVEVIPGLLEIGSEVVIGFLTLKRHVGANYLSGGGHGFALLEDELTGRFTVVGGELGSVLRDH